MQRDIYTVSRLNLEVKALLENSFPLLWLEGEISNLATPASGHMYLSLKDEFAQVRCAMFRNKNRLLNFTPKNGMQVLVRARLGLYEPRGEFQIILEHMEESGEGALRRQFEMLKTRLQTEGLFDAQHKQELPEWPRQVGVITSATGAAIRDILSTLKRRMPNLPVIVYPVAVQGENSVAEIINALSVANRRNECDVLILARGGGSLEDLWSFNDEKVARAVFNSNLPVVCGVGHEVDITISDFVADYRAETPTAAAEAICADRYETGKQLSFIQNKLTRLISSLIQNHKQNLLHYRKRLKDPIRLIQSKSQRLDELNYRLITCQNRKLDKYRADLNVNREKLKLHSPVQKIRQHKSNYQHLHKNLLRSIERHIESNRQRFSLLGQHLHAVSPLSTLERGYSITTDSKHNIVKSVSEVSSTQKIITRVKDGNFISTIDTINYDKQD